MNLHYLGIYGAGIHTERPVDGASEKHMHCSYVFLDVKLRRLNCLFLSSVIEWGQTREITVFSKLADKL